MVWWRQLGKGFKKFFGRQLPQGMQKFGRQLSTVGNTVASDVDKGRGVISNLERASNALGNPVLTGVLHGLGAGAGVLSSGARAAGGAGQALTSLSTGDWKGAGRAGQGALANLQRAGTSGGDLVTTAAPLLPLLGIL